MIHYVVVVAVVGVGKEMRKAKKNTLSAPLHSRTTHTYSMSHCVCSETRCETIYRNEFTVSIVCAQLTVCMKFIFIFLRFIEININICSTAVLSCHRHRHIVFGLIMPVRCFRSRSLNCETACATPFQQDWEKKTTRKNGSLGRHFDSQSKDRRPFRRIDDARTDHNHSHSTIICVVKRFTDLSFRSSTISVRSWHKELNCRKRNWCNPRWSITPAIPFGWCRTM